MSQQSSISSNGHVALQPCPDTFPFASELSLAPLVAFWQQSMHPDHPVEGALAVKVQQALQEAPALLEPITDGSVIAQHQEIVDTLMSVIFPRASGDEVHAAALWPFHLRSFYATPAFARRLLAEDGCMRGRPNVGAALIEQIRILYAYALVLERVYGLNVDFAYPLIYTATDPDTGLDCHFKAVWNTRFVEVRTVGEIPPMTEALHNQVLANLGNTQALMDLLPPEHFLFHGFLVLNALEVTDQEVLSSLKRDLIDRESLLPASTACKPNCAPCSDGRSCASVSPPGRANNSGCSMVKPRLLTIAFMRTRSTTRCRNSLGPSMNASSPTVNSFSSRTSRPMRHARRLKTPCSSKTCAILWWRPCSIKIP